MHRAQAIAVCFLLLAASCDAGPIPQPHLAAGERAYEYTAEAVAFGPRPAGSENQRKLRSFILDHLARKRCSVEKQEFSADTPLGRREMMNILAEFPGESGRTVVVSGHYDTYARPGLVFVGANDAGSSTGFLLALADALQKKETRDTILLAFFDGEESTVAWRDGDHTYGSRHLATKWAAAGRQSEIKALLNVDMIGDSSLRLVYEGNSTPWLRDLVWGIAAELGYGEHFPRTATGYIEDDHVPFLQRGFPAVNLIDFEYGAWNRFWHTEQDSMDKLAPESFAVMMHVVLQTLDELEKRP